GGDALLLPAGALGLGGQPFLFLPGALGGLAGLLLDPHLLFAGPLLGLDHEEPSAGRRRGHQRRRAAADQGPGASSAPIAALAVGRRCGVAGVLPAAGALAGPVGAGCALAGDEGGVGVGEG